MLSGFFGISESSTPLFEQIRNVGDYNHNNYNGAYTMFFDSKFCHFSYFFRMDFRPYYASTIRVFVFGVSEYMNAFPRDSRCTRPSSMSLLRMLFIERMACSLLL